MQKECKRFFNRLYLIVHTHQTYAFSKLVVVETQGKGVKYVEIVSIDDFKQVNDSWFINND